MKTALRKLIKRNFPALVHVQNALAGIQFRNKTPAEVFGSIYARNSWGNDETRSGEGSELEQTRELIRELPKLLEKYRVRTLLDLPCGDFNWMREVALPVERYIGADAVEALVRRNAERFATERIAFVRLDLVGDPLVDADMILCRDCLVHLSFRHIGEAFENLQRSAIEYLLTTSYARTTVNRDVVTGGWRKLNLRMPPFNFPEPLDLIDEKCTEGRYFADKILGLWKVEDIRNASL